MTTAPDDAGLIPDPRQADLMEQREAALKLTGG